MMLLALIIHNSHEVMVNVGDSITSLHIRHLFSVYHVIVVFLKFHQNGDGVQLTLLFKKKFIYDHHFVNYHCILVSCIIPHKHSTSALAP